MPTLPAKAMKAAPVAATQQSTIKKWVKDTQVVSAVGGGAAAHLAVLALQW